MLESLQPALGNKMLDTRAQRQALKAARNKVTKELRTRKELPAGDLLEVLAVRRARGAAASAASSQQEAD
eukprot:7861288-Lingulodinium_polyedra.AAC.1